MKSTLFNMVAVLFGITLIASAGVGAVNMITKEPIAAAEQTAKVEALKQVLPTFEGEPEQTQMTIDDMEIVVYTASNAGDVVGYAVESMTKKGFGGAISMMVGFSKEGEVLNVNILKQAETPGLGTKMADEGNVLINSIQGKNLKDVKLSVKKDGGDVDALTAATISSRAYCDAVARAYEAYKVAAGVSAVAADVASGATAVATENNTESVEPEAQEGGQNE